MINDQVRPIIAAATNPALLWNTPLSPGHAASLIEACAVPPGGRVLDLGCGWGELLLRLVESAPEATGDGVDSDPAALRRSRELLAARTMADRVRFHESPAAGWSGSGYDVAVCIGSTHAWPNGTPDALSALRSALAPGGRALLGDGFWTHDPTYAALSALDATPADYPTLPGLVDLATAAGFRPLQITTASEHEWDLFESAWCAAGEHWARTHPTDPRTPAVHSTLDDHRTGYLSGYRGILGLAYLVLG